MFHILFINNQITNGELSNNATTILSNLTELVPHLISPSIPSNTPTHVLALLPPSLELLRLHLVCSLTTRLRLITLSNPVFLVSALNSEEHAKPKVIFVEDDLVHGVLEQLVEGDSIPQKDAQEGGSTKTLIVRLPTAGKPYRNIDGLTDRAKGMGVQVIRFEELLKPSGRKLEKDASLEDWGRPG
jgi:hypothetical protein